MTELVDARPEIEIDISTSAGAFDDLSSVTWTTIAALVEDWKLKRGRQHERNATVPASGSATLDNIDRRFDGSYSGGPYGSALAMPKRRIRKVMKWGPIGTITGATNATPIVITQAAHGRTAGEFVFVQGVFGNLAANGYRKVGTVAANTYELLNPYTDAPIAGTGAYTSGGTAQRFYWRFHGYVADFPNSWQGVNVAKAEVELLDAFAIFNEIPIPGSGWELEVGDDHPSFWFKPGSGSVAMDASGGNHHGTYQGRPGFEDGIIPGYDGAGFAPNRDDTPGARASFPYPDLITGFPFTVETVLKSNTEASASKQILSAFESAGSLADGYVTFSIESTGGGFEGRLRAQFAVAGFGRYIRSSVRVDDGVPHHVVWVANAYNDMELWVDGVDVTAAGGGSGTVFPTNLSVGFAIGNYPALAYGDFSFATQPGDALGDVVIYNGTALSSTRIAEHYTASRGWGGDLTGTRLNRLLDWIDWPVADRDIDDGQTRLPPQMPAGPLLAYIQRIEQAEAGRTYIARNGKFTHRDRYTALTSPGNVSQFTFGDGTGEIAYDPPAIWGGTESELVTRVEGNRVGGPRLPPAISANEGASGTPGIRALSFSDLQVEDDNIARDYLAWQLARYEEPRPRVRSVTVKPQEDAVVVWPLLLGAEDGSMATFTALPPGGGAEFSQDSLIEACDESWTPKDVTMAYALSPADLTVYAQFGTAQFGTAIFAF